MARDFGRVAWYRECCSRCLVVAAQARYANKSPKWFPTKILAVAIVDCHRREPRTDRRYSELADEEEREEGACWEAREVLLKVAARQKKRPFALRQLCMYARMRNRDTRPLYEQYLMDCIGRAQTLNLTFTIIAALRGGMRARGGEFGDRARGVEPRYTTEYDDARR